MKNYKGVRWVTETQRWLSTIRENGVSYNCGSHVEQRDAVKARDKAIATHGLKAKLQILKPVEKP
jgi:hypothetical protein